MQSVTALARVIEVDELERRIRALNALFILRFPAQVGPVSKLHPS